MTQPKTVELLFLGDELLLGLCSNSHLTFIGQRLSRSGLKLPRAQEIPDDPAAIRRAFLEARKRADIVITTGGLGPTSDDRTIDALAEALGRSLHHHTGIEASIRAHFQRRGAHLTDNNLRQCRIIEGAEVLENSRGTAPGQWLENDDGLLLILPGPPSELQPMFEESVLPRLIGLGWANERIPFLQIRTSGMGESQVAAILDPLFDDYGDRLQSAYCAHNGLVDVRLVAQTEEALSPDELQALGDHCRDALGPAFVTFGDTPLSEIIIKHLRSLGKRLAVAESCTAGLLAARFADAYGASKVFVGGLVCYRNEAKENLLGIPSDLLEQHGAVSPECAVAMATGAAETFEADYALSVTGYAGPEGGREPVGTVYLGYYSPIGVWSCKIHHPGTREAVRERAVNSALDFMRRKLKKYEVHELLEQLRC